MSSVKIAALQAESVPGSPEENIAVIARAAEEAREAGCELLITPELFTTGYVLGPEPMRGFAHAGLADRVAGIAGGVGIGVIAVLPEADGDAVYNTAFLFSPEGEILARHRKTHLFGDLDRSMFVPGETAVNPVDFHGVRIAMFICYDVEFPENVRLAADAGAHLVAVPTAQMEPFAIVADVVVRTRAWENQVYLAYVNHEGHDQDLTYVGRSSIVGPDGEVLASAGRGTRLITATVDTEAVNAAQAANPYLTDRRRDLY
ncbi:carbon-nitrogen hydrolase family protein [Tsukamurella strandjordii]|uniref:Carbon-nitrogen hydrolase family protein n=1 Tax=Tsukamurella strandjordii TaxID=147577 RepID=A0AA90N7U4_9ACTN|nr:carbon-nitrogen hydrolase family protein [Tsukamurella strandjordii]MDP0396633.1 carbon-nitrogen hydrolase family protein [Tsukamurella strandjordii]